MSQSNSDDHYIRICHTCISHLSDRFVYEKGLFRTHASMNDIRAFKRQLLLDTNSFASRIRSESDPHIVVGVIQACLKDMTACLLHEVYEDVMRLEVTEATDSVITAITSWIINIPSPKFELVQALCNLLVRVASLGGNESVLQSLTNNIAPYVCRPTNTQFMSIRHQSDLKRSRIVVAFLIEHVKSIFTADLVPRLTATAASKSGKGSTSISTHTTRKPTVPRLIDFNSGLGAARFDDEIESFPRSLSGNSSSASADEFALVRTGSNDSDNGVNGNLNSAQQLNIMMNLQSWEWSVLESIAASKVDFFLRPRELQQQQSGPSAVGSSSSGAGLNTTSSNTNIFKNSSSPLDFDIASLDQLMSNANALALVAGNGNIGNIGNAVVVGGGRPGTPATGLWSNSSSSKGKSDVRPLPSSGSNAARMLRRKLVAEVKQLRAEISRFEEDWIKRHNRPPKASERGQMSEVYEKYRTLKRNVRDNAAKSIQRLVRGFLTRKAFQYQISNNKGVRKMINRLFLTPLAADSMPSSSAMNYSSPMPMSLSPSPSSLTSAAAAAAASNGGSLSSSPAGLSLLSINLNGPSAQKRKMPDPPNSIGSGGNSDGANGKGSASASASASASSSSSSSSSLGMEAGLSGDIDDASHAHYGSGNKMAADIFVKFRDLWGQKHELKRRLKKFDDDFCAQYNRQPSKAEKEVMRPMYDKYHEVKAVLDSLKAEIEASNETIPENILSLLGPIDRSRKQSASSIISVSEDIGGNEETHVKSGEEVPNSEAMQVLLDEKKTLHSYLKEYEREFTRTHGRPVMRQEDIQPVAQEYRRYKELKSLTAKK